MLELVFGLRVRAGISVALGLVLGVRFGVGLVVRVKAGLWGAGKMAWT